MSARGLVRSLRGRTKSASTKAPAESTVMRVAQSGSARVDRDPLDTALAALAAAPSDAYWARRLVDLVRDPMAAWRYRTHVATAVCTWVRQDVSFFVHERYLSEQLAAWAWPREIFDELEVILQLEERSLTHFVMGRLWLEARRTPTDLPEFYGHAARHLLAVAAPFRTGAWAESAAEALSVANPKELARRANEILGAASPLAHERALLAVLRGAARAGDWKLYDAHRRSYESAAPDGGLRSNSELEELDGKRAEQNMVLRYKAPVFEDEEPRIPELRVPTFGRATVGPPKAR